MQAADESILRKEARVFSRYLIGKEPSNLSVQLYIKALQKLDIPMSPRDQRKLSFILRFPFFISMIDGALAMVNPEHPIRKKLYVMSSILESDPACNNYFLPKDGTSLFTILLTGTRAVFNTLFGFILLPWI
jgi:hypothetical protein